MSKLPIRVRLKNYYPEWLYRKIRLLRDRKLIERWKEDGQPIPAVDAYKRKILAKFVELNNRNIFIETGTFLGDTVFEIYPLVDRVITIEISKELKTNAERRFFGNNKVQILEGDSATVLASIDPKKLKNDRVIFWLDGHYSGGYTGKGSEITPIYRELDCIKEFQYNHVDSIIIIDDKRLFTGNEGYPKAKDLIVYVESLFGCKVKEYHDFFVFSLDSKEINFPSPEIFI
ncbi:MAG: hypothetical protein KDC83_03620 [Flavobacteriales bacterium]|nr:hypothetical protein [Flavobacteriales bacterium]